MKKCCKGKCKTKKGKWLWQREQEEQSLWPLKQGSLKLRGILPVSVTTCDVYVAINSQYHNYAMLFKSWFGNDIEQKIIESAIIYWFKDDDQINKYTWFKHMNEY